MSFSVSYTLRIAVITCDKIQLKGKWGVGFTVQGYIGHHGGQNTVAGALGSWSHSIHSQETERSKCWCSAGLLSYVKSGSPAHFHGAAHIQDVSQSHDNTVNLT